jgi:hypothetical protein
MVYTVKRIVLATVVVCFSCQHGSSNSGTTPHGEGDGAEAPIELPEEITESNYPASVRQLRSASLQAPGRSELRRLVIGPLRSNFDEAVDDDPAQAWEHFSEAVSLYSTSELQPGGVDRAV